MWIMESLLLYFIQQLASIPNIFVLQAAQEEMAGSMPSPCKAKIIEGTQLFWAVATLEYQDEEKREGSVAR